MSILARVNIFLDGTDRREKGLEVTKEASALDEKVYRGTWGDGHDSYFPILADRLVLARELLASTGMLFVHIGPNVNHLVRTLLDDCFGPEQHGNEIVWKRTFVHSDARRFSIVHDCIVALRGEGIGERGRHTK